MANAFAMLPLKLAGATASSTAAGYDPTYVANDYAGVVWKSAGGAASASLTIDLGSAKSIDTALLFGCTGATAGWTMTIAGADDAAITANVLTVANAVPFLAGANFPTHGRGVGYWAGDAASAARRYWRITIANLANAQVTVARLAIGLRAQLARNFEFGAAFGVRDLGTTDRSAAGALLRRRAAKLRILGINFPAVTKQEAIAKVQPIIEMAAGQEAIVIVTDPAVDADRQKCCWIGTITGDIGQVWKRANGWEWKVNLTDLIPIPAGIA